MQEYHLHLCQISIHVPAWGTTGSVCGGCGRGTISIHVPAWGTTFHDLTVSFPVLFQSTFPRGERHNSFCIKPGAAVDFNPRSRVGNDHLRPGLRICLCISIHVPAWGTTANFHKYSLLFYAINIIFLLFIIPSLFSLVLFVLLF